MSPGRISPGSLPARSPEPLGLRPGQLWSLWDMLDFDAGLITETLNTLVRIERLMAGHDGWIDQEGRRQFYAGRIALLIPHLEKLGMKTSAHKAGQLKIMLDGNLGPFTNPSVCQVLKDACESLRDVIKIELSGRHFYGPVAGYEKYYGQVELFGSEVFKKFPSANEDIYEAGMCLSLERGTACVMHTMRVLEVGLLVLAGTLGITNKNDWGAYLRGIETELDARTKAAGARTADEQFYAEAAAGFDRVRRAFRNPTMHVGASYSSERAEDILLASKSFMGHLATKLSESLP